LNNLDVNDFSYNEGEMIIAGSSGLFFISQDGKNWTDKSVLLGPHFIYARKVKGEYIALTGASSISAEQIWSSKDMFFWDIFEVIRSGTILTLIFNERDAALRSITANDKTILINGYICGSNSYHCTGYIVTSQ
jgi:hypothetical protein